MCDPVNEQIKVEAIKCMIVGDSKTGKTHLYRRLLGQSLPSEYSPTVFDVNNTEAEHNGERLNLAMWDSAGSNVYDSIRPISYAHTDCFIICYGIHDRMSYENVEVRWLPEIIRHGDGPRVPIILVAINCDCQSSDDGEEAHINFVTESEGMNMQEKVKARAFFQCSSLKDENVQRIMGTMIELAFQKKVEEEKPPNPIWKFKSLNIIVTGDVGVGKSSIIEASIKDQTQETKQNKDRHNYKLQEYYHDFVADGCEYFLRIIELPFGNDYLGTLHELCEQTDLIILCYAINDPFSFQSVDQSCRSILEHASKEIPIILIGNKSDLKESSPIIIPTADGEELKDQMKCTSFIECSAKTSDSIPNIFQSFVDIFTNDDNDHRSNA